MIFDARGGYKQVSDILSRKRHGFKVLPFSVKAHIMYAMYILTLVWENIGSMRLRRYFNCFGGRQKYFQ